ncbi:S8 family peptidase [Chryseobacterium chendengshani]|uniref:S8 family peptidase n=1 Tax=Chryseobacterium sp. LJ668 TaxID=2864040 RepID=UPI001C68DBB1|nr:S8 family peptidase [Chryseobacterium sp. LJ668]MBW8522141.1 S8 family peptidase [Chryseobacterium sp. LJ668]QYK17788.1 S8 family peptidase [Chryseobacterium sp. LJ668]
MNKFPHLKFSEKIVGTAKFDRSIIPINPKTLKNKSNRKEYSIELLRKTTILNKEWTGYIVQREELNLAPLAADVFPVYLQLNPSLFSDANFDLHKFGIEIISEENDGFIIGASTDSLRSLQEKISLFFSQERGGEKIAEFWQIITGDRKIWKPQHILTPELQKKWETINDEEIYKLEVSIAFDMPLGAMPDATKHGGKKRLAKYYQQYDDRMLKYDEREAHFLKFIRFYNAELHSGLIDLEDSFGCHISLSGRGLKDLVINYPFVFEVGEIESINSDLGIEAKTLDCNAEILPPEEDSPEIGIIDSGIMEGHKYLSSAIKPENSRSYLTSDSSTADKVSRGGHGTKVAGAALYPKGLSNLTSEYKLPFFVRNLRVLDHNNNFEHHFPAELMKRIVEENDDCKIFNLSISSTASFRTKHMSNWAAMLDKLIYERNVLFINAVGNINSHVIKHYLSLNKYPYPHYLERNYCRLANPAQSSFSISVGSINHLSLDNVDWASIGNENEVAPYSRIGTGIWGHIKPDVVEYGGGMQVSKNGLFTISYKDTSSELLRTTTDGGSAFNQESVGTSYATPKVTHIAAELSKLYKDENVNLIRALLVQGARLPNDHFYNPTTVSIKHFGYGIPSLERVTNNTEHRITLYNTNFVKAKEAQIYSLKIPAELRDPGDSYDVLLEITLGFTAKNRRTRQKTKSYLSTWLEWKCSNLNDTYDDFRKRTLSDFVHDGESDENFSSEVIQFKIREQSNWGAVKDINRNRSSLQKDWAIIKSYELPEEIHIAVLGHQGWDLDKEEIPYALTVSLEILGSNIPIYELIRIENEIEIESEI